MKIIKYFEVENKEYWLMQMDQSDWKASHSLVKYIRENIFFDRFGKDSELLLLVEEGRLVGHATICEVDDIVDTDLKPWIGFVCIMPEFRGHCYTKLLLDKAIQISKNKGFSRVYICTGEENLYEKFGATFIGLMKDRHNKDAKVYYFE